MYHGIVDVKDTKYVGGNVDKDGYNRTADAFREDLEFYYNKGYRMIRLSDYVDGVIDGLYEVNDMVPIVVVVFGIVKSTKFLAL